jgi:chemotaxis protein methyltransferase CheR
VPHVRRQGHIRSHASSALIDAGNGPGKGLERDFLFTDRDFKFIRELVLESTGIVLSDIKRDMVYGRLSRRIRKLGLEKFSDYCALLKDEDQNELREFTNAITTNLTSFFRESHHFEFLRHQLIPRLLREKAERKLRIWSAGCSTGEEPYSIAMTVKEALPDSAGWDVKILATDLDTNVLDHGREGIYGIDRVAGLPRSQLGRWFRRGKGANEGMVRVSEELRQIISFKQLNLIGEWPMKSPFDIIFCRNVVIYFDKDTQRRLFDRYSRLLVKHGHLFLGHSETMFKMSNSFRLVGKTVYENGKDGK